MNHQLLSQYNSRLRTCLLIVSKPQHSISWGCLNWLHLHLYGHLLKASGLSSSWKVLPTQCLLHRAYDVPVAACIGLDNEMERQPRYGINVSMVPKHRGETMVSPMSKITRQKEADIHDRSQSPFLALPKTPKKSSVVREASMASQEKVK